MATWLEMLRGDVHRPIEPDTGNAGEGNGFSL